MGCRLVLFLPRTRRCAIPELAFDSDFSTWDPCLDYRSSDELWNAVAEEALGETDPEWVLQRSASPAAA
jgi:hypothetical protein